MHLDSIRARPGTEPRAERIWVVLALGRGRCSGCYRTSLPPLGSPPTSWSRSPPALIPYRDGRIYIELVNKPFLKMGGTGEEFRAAVALAKERGWIEPHESGTFVRLISSRN